MFARWRIDSCGGGTKSLATVVERRGLAVNALLADLGAAATGPG